MREKQWKIKSCSLQQTLNHKVYLTETITRTNNAAGIVGLTWRARGVLLRRTEGGVSETSFEVLTWRGLQVVWLRTGMGRLWDVLWATHLTGTAGAVATYGKRASLRRPLSYSIDGDCSCCGDVREGASLRRLWSTHLAGTAGAVATYGKAASLRRPLSNSCRVSNRSGLCCVYTLSTPFTPCTIIRALILIFLQLAFVCTYKCHSVHTSFHA